MDAAFWLDRWQEGRTHFHMQRVTPLLQKYWPALRLPAGSRILVPLCGKSLDMIWLASQGYRVLGVELSPLAIAQFLQENDLRAQVRESPLGRHHVAGEIEIIEGDIFGLDAATLAGCAGAYDRAALVALPEAMRKDYVRHVYGQLAGNYRGLLLTLHYDQSSMEGPPFSVDEEEVARLYADHTRARLVDRRDILAKEPKFAQRGLTALDTLVFDLSGARGD
ncbi:thiopurine S-methyltransferase [Allopusillimonas soli]|uniref:Thiopurine S-methyltransferase n=1 Tax=Allopusillimonas soli TaxID=659016 RepID=A0A853FCM6_9BURK|nr:thiopurine S-methyltransferase [Allopusillimonas soli]NYT37659.1 thiopurine S-methyltransferase [Allopusillimonas soli]TEA74383.1 thiopurine S-methyltransferase [Allopusillimonas soli]